MHIEQLGGHLQEILAARVSSLREAKERLVVSPFREYIIGRNSFLGHLWSFIWAATRLINWDGSWERTNFQRALMLTAHTWLDVHQTVIASGQTLKTFLRTSGPAEKVLASRDLVFQHLLSYRIYIGQPLTENEESSFETGIEQLNRLFHECLPSEQPTSGDIRECLQDGAYLYFGSRLGREALPPVRTIEKIVRGDATDLEDEQAWRLFSDKLLEKIDCFTPDLLITGLQRYIEHLGLSAGFLRFLFLLKETFAQQGHADFWQSDSLSYKKKVLQLVRNRGGVIEGHTVGEVVDEEAHFYTFSLPEDPKHLIWVSKHNKSHLLAEMAAFLHSRWRGLLPKAFLLGDGEGLLIEKQAPFSLITSPSLPAARELAELIKTLLTERKWPVGLTVSHIRLQEKHVCFTRPFSLVSPTNVYDQAALFLCSLSASRATFLSMAITTTLTKHPANLYYRAALFNSLGGLQENLSAKRERIQEIDDLELQQNTTLLIEKLHHCIKQCSVHLRAKYAVAFAFPIKQLLGPPLIEELFTLAVAALPYNLREDEAALYALRAAQKEKFPLLPIALGRLPPHVGLGAS